jgi:uncharacterized membrane protein YbaN (DUF454 family)
MENIVNSRSSKVQRGFFRLGILGLVPVLIITCGFFVVAGVTYFRGDSQYHAKYQITDPSGKIYEVAAPKEVPGHEVMARFRKSQEIAQLDSTAAANIVLYQELYRRGAVPPEHKDTVNELVRRGIIQSTNSGPGMFDDLMPTNPATSRSRSEALDLCGFGLMWAIGWVLSGFLEK